MDGLPPELLRCIVNHVDHTDLGPLRLVNRDFAAAGAPRLFEVVPLWISVRSLERLTHISEHPQLSLYPKQIIFSPTRVINYGDAEPYRDKVEDWLQYQPSSLSKYQLAMSKHMTAYAAYIEGQLFLSTDGLDVKILTKALSNLPGLKTFHVDHWDTFIGSDDLIFNFGVFKAEHLLSLDCQYTLPTLMKVLAASTVKIKVFHLGRDNYPEASILDSFVDYSSATSLARPRRLHSPARPLRFNLRGYSYPTMMSSQAWWMTFADANLKTCTDALSDLRELKVGGINLTCEDAASVLRVVNALRRLMMVAPYLEAVTLNEISSDYFADQRPAMDSIIPYHGLRMVKKLSLDHYQTNVVSLSDFFRRHGHTIVHVHFSFVAISSGNWSTALAQLRNLPFPRLKTFVLSHCDGKEVDLQVQDYILKKTDVDPLLAVREGRR